jgi:hypothetical protein
MKNDTMMCYATSESKGREVMSQLATDEQSELKTEYYEVYRSDPDPDTIVVSTRRSPGYLFDSSVRVKSEYTLHKLDQADIDRDEALGIKLIRLAH